MQIRSVASVNIYAAQLTILLCGLRDLIAVTFVESFYRILRKKKQTFIVPIHLNYLPLSLCLSRSFIITHKI